MDDKTINLWMPLFNPLGWAAGGANRRRSQSQRMSGSGQSESAFRTWRNGMPLLRGFDNGIRIGLAMSWSGQTRRYIGAACSLILRKIPGSDLRAGMIVEIVISGKTSGCL